MTSNSSKLIKKSAVDISNPEDEEEVDFMSDEFLAECTKNDVKPGLIFKNSDKRHLEQLKKKDKERELVELKKKAEEINRNKGLETQIGSDNKGFKMLEKMGFKPGATLGKRKPDDSLTIKLKEPIPIEIKKGRGCLGQKTVCEEKSKKREELGDLDSYRSRLLISTSSKIILKDLANSQKVCMDLDEKNEVKEPVQIWYWPKISAKTEESELDKDLKTDTDLNVSSEIEPEPESKLKSITSYLRSKHNYCVWCGTKFNDNKDMIDSCPGDSRDLH